eukprot:1061091-Prorocentrum_minimum.AAC.1
MPRRRKVEVSFTQARARVHVQERVRARLWGWAGWPRWQIWLLTWRPRWPIWLLTWQPPWRFAGAGLSGLGPPRAAGERRQLGAGGT